jgi:hypothetical protein
MREAGAGLPPRYWLQMFPPAQDAAVFESIRESPDEVRLTLCRHAGRAEWLIRMSLHFDERRQSTLRVYLNPPVTDEPGTANSATMISVIALRYSDMSLDFAIALRDKVESLVDMTSSSRYYARLASQSMDPAMIGKLKDYANCHVAAGSRRATETGINNIEYCVRKSDKRLPEIDAWLEEQGD